MSGKKAKKPDKSTEKKGHTNPALVEDDESDLKSESEKSGAVTEAHSNECEFEYVEKPSGHRSKLRKFELKKINCVCHVGKTVMRVSIGSPKDEYLPPGPEPSPKPQTKETPATSRKDLESGAAARCEIAEFNPDTEPSTSRSRTTLDTDVDSLGRISSLPKDDYSVAEASETGADDGAGPRGTESGSMKKRKRSSDDNEEKSPKPEDEASN